MGRLYPQQKKRIENLVNMIQIFTTKKTKNSEGNLVTENMKSLSNSEFCDQEIYEEFYFFRH